MESINCVNGCSSNDKVIIRSTDLLHDKPGVFTVVKCLDCGLVRTNPRPDCTEIGDFYPENYSPFVGTKVSELEDRPSIKRSTIQFLKKYIDFKINSIPLDLSGRALEIGCASGSYLVHLRNLNFDVDGVETDLLSVKRAERLGFNIFHNSLERVSLNDDEYELIVGWMVMEHVHEPKLVFEKLYKSAKHGGKMVISVPNISCLQFLLFGKYWYPLQLPTHLFHYDKRTISKLATDSGWRVDSVVYQRILDDVFLSFGLLFKANGFTRLSDFVMTFTRGSLILRILLYPMACFFAFLGQTSRMTITLHKI